LILTVVIVFVHAFKHVQSKADADSLKPKTLTKAPRVEDAKLDTSWRIAEPLPGKPHKSHFRERPSQYYNPLRASCQVEAAGKIARRITIPKGGYAIEFDGRQGPTFSSIGLMILSADGKHLAYEVEIGNGEAVVVDGRQGPVFASVGWDRWFGHQRELVVFSPDGNRYAYAAEVGGKSFAVIDGMPDFTFHWVRGLKFSPDGNRIGYIGCIKGPPALDVIMRPEYPVVDGVVYPGGDIILDFAFSPDSSRFAYIAGKGVRGAEGPFAGTPFICIDGKVAHVHSEHHSQSHFYWSPELHFIDDNTLTYKLDIGDITREFMLSRIPPGEQIQSE